MNKLSNSHNAAYAGCPHWPKNRNGQRILKTWHNKYKFHYQQINEKKS